MYPFVAVVIGMGCCGSLQERGMAFCVVDADSGRPLGHVKVERWASMWQPRILMPPGRFWFPASSEPTCTDDAGEVRFESYKSDDRYYVKAEGYETAFVAPGWFRWTVSNDGTESTADLSRQDGFYVVPIKAKKTSYDEVRFPGAARGKPPCR